MGGDRGGKEIIIIVVILDIIPLLLTICKKKQQRKLKRCCFFVCVCCSRRGSIITNIYKQKRTRLDLDIVCNKIIRPRRWPMNLSLSLDHISKLFLSTWSKKKYI